MTYTNHSGGCPGADMTWETEGLKHGITTIAYSFYNHVQKGSNPKKLSMEELAEGFENVKKASKTLKRTAYHPAPYVRNLLSRNWFQVKNAEAIYAIGKFADSHMKLVSGGTGWAVQMAVDNKKPIFFFDQPTDSWYLFDYEQDKFKQIDFIPTLVENFAGIGTREIQDNGIQAIKDVLNETFF